MESSTIDYKNKHQFLQMEESCALFDYKERGIPIWEIFRHYIYMRIYFPHQSTDTDLKKTKKSLYFYFNGLKILLYSVFSWVFYKKTNLLFECVRNVDTEGHLFDIVSENIIQELMPDILIVECVRVAQKKRYKYKAEYNFVNVVCSFLRTKHCLSQEIFLNIENAIDTTFGKNKITYEELNHLYIQFQKQYKYYKSYFKYKKPKRVFFIQNGIQKGMICAAKHLNIPIFELQHGTPPGYVYPSNIKENDDRIIVPDAILTFSSYWGKNVNLPTLTIPIGNDFFAERTTCPEDHSILFISSSIHGDCLSEFVVEFARLHPEITINFKLHPSEFRKDDFYKKMFSLYDNIHIFKNELPVKTLSARSSLVVLIASTVFFEALHTNAKVGVYKKLDYESLSDYFTLPNVYLLDSVEDLHHAYCVEKKENTISFFDKFDKTQFYNLLTS